MMHGPCGVSNPNSPCMEDGKCTKKFPKDFTEQTYSAHTNVEICSTINSCKYLYKYVYKGPDMASVQVVQNQADPADTSLDTQPKEQNEIKKNC